VVVGREQAEVMDRDSQNVEYMAHATIADGLDQAMRFAHTTARTDKVIIFDGAVGGINVSTSLAQELLARAPGIEARVNDLLLP